MDDWQPALIVNAHDFEPAEGVEILYKRVVRVRYLDEAPPREGCRETKRYIVHPDDAGGNKFYFCKHEILTD